MTNVRIVLTTPGSAEEAHKIAHTLVERHQAACVNIVPQITSVYRWQSKVETAAEWLLIIKTHCNSFAEARATIESLHSYELPECIMLEVGDGAHKYLDWVEKNSLELGK
jgi:periplasmic divalent cation tolerance protein